VFSEEESLQRGLENVMRRSKRKLHREMRQIRAVLSEEEQRNVKRLRKYEREGARTQLSRWSTDSVEITIWPYQKERE
jgi:hypothetical protein